MPKEESVIGLIIVACIGKLLIKLFNLTYSSLSVKICGLVVNIKLGLFVS